MQYMKEYDSLAIWLKSGFGQHRSPPLKKKPRKKVGLMCAGMADQWSGGDRG